MDECAKLRWRYTTRPFDIWNCLHIPLHFEPTTKSEIGNDRIPDHLAVHSHGREHSV